MHIIHYKYTTYNAIIIIFFGFLLLGQMWVEMLAFFCGCQDIVDCKYGEEKNVQISYLLNYYVVGENRVTRIKVFLYISAT